MKRSGMPLWCLWAVWIENEGRTSSPNSVALWTGCMNGWAAGQSLRKLKQGKHKASGSLRTLIQVSRGTCRSRPVAVHTSRKLRETHAGVTYTHKLVSLRTESWEYPFFKRKEVAPIYRGGRGADVAISLNNILCTQASLPNHLSGVL
jgi:hypothetical protein